MVEIDITAGRARFVPAAPAPVTHEGRCDERGTSHRAIAGGFRVSFAIAIAAAFVGLLLTAPIPPAAHHTRWAATGVRAHRAPSASR